MTAEDQHDEKREAGERIVTLLRHLFHNKFCPMNDVTEDQKGGVLPAYFYGWLHKHMILMNTDTECEAAGVSLADWSNLVDIVDGGGAVEQLVQQWYTIVLSTRPQPKHPLQSLNMIVVATWEDKTISITQSFLSKEMIQNETGFNDPLTAAIMAHNFRTLLAMIVKNGLDKLHDSSQDYRFTSPAPEDPYDVTMGLILKHIPQLKPELQEPVRNFMRLAQQCIRPPVPKHLVEAYAARKKQAEAKAIGKPQGGWNT